MNTRYGAFSLAVVIGSTCLCLVRPCQGQDGADSSAPRRAQSRSIDELLLFFPTKHPEGEFRLFGRAR